MDYTCVRGHGHADSSSVRLKGGFGQRLDCVGTRIDVMVIRELLYLS